MYSGMSQTKIAKEMFMSQSKYNRKENGKIKIERGEAIKLAKILDLNEKVILRYWMADQLHELMQYDKNLVHEAFKIVEEHFDDYDNYVTLPQRNSSYSSLAERMKRRKKKEKITQPFVEKQIIS